ncbi:MAG TPA: thioredoxin [Candidatus Woesearchaeota archaeon]|nr:thioredoxin [Candidatus Woesearchaeota archaeon]
MITELTEENFEHLTRQGKVIIDFYAEWCGPCKVMEPVLEEVSKEFKDINFFKINVDSNHQPALIHSVRSIPTIIFLKNGNEVDRIMGVTQEEEFKKRITQAFK